MSRHSRVGPALAVLLLAPVLLPIGDASDHAPAIPTIPPLPEAPRTGASILDSLLQKVRQEQNATIQALARNATGTYANASSLAAGRVLEERVHADGRIGGFGPWTQIGGSEWHADREAAYEGGWGLAFATPDGLYPRSFNDSYYVTPEIDLTRALAPRVEDDAVNSAGKEACQTPPVPIVNARAGQACIAVNSGPFPDPRAAALANPIVSPILLTIVHRANFHAGTDGARIEVLEAPPRSAERPTSATVLLPIPYSTRNASSAGTTVGYAPEVTRFQTDEAAQGPPYNNNPAANSMAFTGTFDWNVSVFDLTPFAGRSIWIAFHVKTGYGRIVEDPTRFARTDFYGWQIDNVNVRAPTTPHYLRLDDVTIAPSTSTPGDDALVLPPETPSRLNVTVHNAGAWRTNATLDLTLRTPAGDTLEAPSALAVELEAGEVQAHAFDVPPLPEGQRVIAEVRLAYANANDTANLSDAHHQADRLRRVVMSAQKTSEILVSLALDDFVVATGQEARLRANVTNKGNSPDRVTLALDIRDRNNATRDPPVLVTSGSRAETRTLLPNETATYAWTLRATSPGRYAVTVCVQTSATCDRPIEATLNVGQGPVVRYHYDFANGTALAVNLPEPLVGAAAVWTGNATLILGGSKGADKEPTKEAWLYTPSNAPGIRPLDPLPAPVANGSAVWNGTHGLLLGGETTNGALSDAILAYDPATSRNSTIGNLPTPRRSTSAYWDGQSAVLLGGRDSTGLLDEILRIEATDEGNVTTQVVGRLPTPREGAGAVWAGDRAFIFGGINMTGRLAEIVSFDGASTEVKAARLPTNRSGTAAAWDGRYAYVFGGEDANGTLAQIVRYDPKDDTVLTMNATLPVPTANLSAARADDRIHLLGGVGPMNLFTYDARNDTIRPDNTTITRGLWTNYDVDAPGAWNLSKPHPIWAGASVTFTANLGGPPQPGEGFLLEVTHAEKSGSAALLSASVTYPYAGAASPIRAPNAPAHISPQMAPTQDPGMKVGIGERRTGWTTTVRGLDDTLASMSDRTAGWDPALLGINFTSAGYIAHVKVSYRPRDSDERVTIMEWGDGRAPVGTTFDSANDWGRIKGKTPAEVPHPILNATPDWAWTDNTPIEPRAIPAWATTKQNRLAVTPAFDVSDDPHPVVEVEHHYATLVSSVDPTSSTGMYKDGSNALQYAHVFVQTQRPNGHWTEWRSLTPVGGYPFKGGFAAAAPIATGPSSTGRTGSPWETTRFDLLDQPSAPIDLQAPIRLGFMVEGNTVTPPTDPDRGWWIRALKVLPNPQLVNDVAVGNVTLDTPYDHEGLGIPPDVEIPVRVQIHNPGIGSFVRVQTDLAIQTPNGTMTLETCLESTEPTRCVTPLASAENKTLTFLWTPPGDDPHVQLYATTTIPDAVDEDPSNNVGWLLDHAKLPVRTVRDAAARIEASPPEGDVGERTFDVRVTNHGNVPIHDLKIRRTIVGPQGTMSDVRWVLTGSIPPDGRARSLLDPQLGAKDLSGASVTLAKDLVWAIPATGTYFATIQATGPSPDNDPSNDLATSRFVANDVFFGDDFDADQRGAGGAWATHANGTAWRLVEDAKGRSFRFGDEFEPRSNATLTTPSIDLIAATYAVLEFTTNYSLERAYDAGRVEATTDGGATWTPLLPQHTPYFPHGYPGNASPSNPFNAEHDPTLSVPVLIGDSSQASELARLANGSVPLSFDLGQLAELRTSVALGDLKLDDPNDASAFLPGTKRTFTDPSWTTTDGEWSAEDLDMASMVPPHGRTAAWNNTTAIEFTLPLAKGGRIEIWDWAEGRSTHNPHPIPIRATIGGRIGSPTLTMAAHEGEWTLWRIDEDRLRADICGCEADQVKLRLSAASGRGSAVERLSRYDPTTDSWTHVIDPNSVESVGPWRRVTAFPHTGYNAFSPDPQVEGTTWHWRPVNRTADHRLILPTIDLSAIVGGNAWLAFDSANLTSWGHVAIEVQSFDPLRMEWGDWQTLFANGRPPDHKIDTRPFGDLPAEDTSGYAMWSKELPSSFPKYTKTMKQRNGLDALSDVSYVLENAGQHRFDLTPFAGQKVRLAFHATIDRYALSTPECSKEPPCWTISNVTVEGTAFRGGEVQIRFHASADESVNEGRWTIDDVAITGGMHATNLWLEANANLSRATPDAPVAVGITVTDRGTQRPARLGLRAQSDTPFTLGFPDEAAPPEPVTDVTLPLPSNATNATLLARIPALGEHALRLNLVALDEEDGPKSFRNAIAGAIRQEVRLNVTDPAHELNATLDAPIEASQARPAAITLRIASNGTFAENGTWALHARRVGASNTTCERSGDFTLRPGQRRDVELTCPLTEPGRHDLTVNVTSENARATATGSIIVSPQLLLHASDFETGDGWSGIPTEPSESAPIDPRAASSRYGTSRNSQQNDWKWTTSLSYGGTGSWRFGPDEERYARGDRYGDFQDSALVSSPIDLTNMQGRTAFLQFWHLRDFSLGDGGVVEATVVDGGPANWTRLTPLDGYAGSTESTYQIRPLTPAASTVAGLAPIAQRDECIPCHRNPLGTTLAFAGRAADWELATIDLAQAGFAGATIQLRFRVGTMEATPSPLYPQEGTGWVIDQVVVSSSIIRLPIAQLAIAQSDGSAKTHYLKLVNVGDFSLQPATSLDEERSSVGSKDIFRILQEPPEIEGHGEGLLAIAADSPVLAAGFNSEQILTLAIAAKHAPEMTTQGQLRLLLDPAPHPNLVTRIQSEDGTRLEAGVPHALAVIVENDGDIPSEPARLVLGARHLTSGEVFEIGTIPLPALEPRSTPFVAGFVWTPPPALGAWTLEADADADRVNRNLRPDEARTALAVTVVPLRRPDLRVLDLDATTPAGERLTRAAEGDLVQFAATLSNGGTAPAVDVTIRFNINERPVKIVRLDRMEPGAAHTLIHNQFVRAGVVNYTIDVVNAVPETNLANNRAQGVLLVDGATATWEIANGTTIQLHAGETITLPATLRGNGAEDLTYAIEASSTKPLEARADHTLVRFGNDTEETILLTVHAPIGTPEGIQTAVLLARPTRGGAASVLEIAITVPRERNITLSAPSGPSAAADLKAGIKNSGNAPVSLQLRASTSLETDVLTVQLDVGEERIVHIPLRPTPLSRPGVHDVEIRALEGNETVARATARASVPATAGFTIEADPATSGAIRLASSANVPLAIALNAIGDEGFTGKITPALVELEPGETRTARLTLTGARDASAAEATFRIEAHPSLGGKPQTATASVANPNAALHVAEVTLDPGKSSIRVSIDNRGETASLHQDLRLYVDNVLMGITTTEAIPPKTRARIDIPVSLEPGTHGIIVSLGAADAADAAEGPRQARAFVTQTDPDASGLFAREIPAPAPILATLLAVAAALLQRRRSR